MTNMTPKFLDASSSPRIPPFEKGGPGGICSCSAREQQQQQILPNPPGPQAQPSGVHRRANLRFASASLHPFPKEGVRALAVVIALSLSFATNAQDHSQHLPEPQDHATHQQTDHSRHTPPAGEPGEDPHAGHERPIQDHSEMDHSEMDHSEMDHSEMDHSAMGHDVAGMSGDLPATAAPREPIPPVTAADRAAAFPDVAGHTVHDTTPFWFAQLNRLETWGADEGNALGWEGSGWIGNDLERLWIRSEGEWTDGTTESADVELLYGRAVATWWDAVAGIRHDFGEYPSQTFAAVGVMGLAPYMFEISATAYLGESGQTGVNLEAEYDTRFTNRLVLQSLIEAEAWGKDDPRRGIGSGLGKLEAGLRLRYEFTRQFAPYIGVVHERAYGGTADLHREHGEPVNDTRVVAGLRLWF
ncbi:MAG: copper resistance protein B [Proteobacteria bacterium]|nr:copper resistance protein B [Pseudomonadota bacterium]